MISDAQTLYDFPLNPAFEEQWAVRKEYCVIGGIRFRQLNNDAWYCRGVLSNYATQYSILEGAIILQITGGNAQPGDVTVGMALLESIVREMGWGDKPYYVLVDATNITGSSVEARKETVQAQMKPIHRLQESYIVVNTLVRVGIKLAKPFNPKSLVRHYPFKTLDEAVIAVLRNFRPAVRTHHFPTNPAFEQAWNAQSTPQYIETHGVRLRKITRPEWQYRDESCFSEHIVLEGSAVVLHITKGYFRGTAPLEMGKIMGAIAQEFDLRQRTYYVIADTRGNTGADAAARRNTIAYFNENKSWNYERRNIVMTNSILGAFIKLLRPFNEMIRSWEIHESMEGAWSKVLKQFETAAPHNYAAQNPSQGSPQTVGVAQNPIRTALPANPMFEELWANQRSYVTVGGRQLRAVSLDAWKYRSPSQDYSNEYAVLEGHIVLQKTIGCYTAEDVVTGQQLLETVLENVSLMGKSFYLVADTRSTFGADSIARRAVAEVYNHSLYKTHQGIYVVMSEQGKVRLQWMSLLNPRIRKWHIFNTMEAAFDGLFMAISANNAPQSNRTRNLENIDNTSNAQNVQNAQSAQKFGLAAAASTAEYQAQRLEQIYALLARIADNDLEVTIPLDVPDNDPYSDVFKALGIVVEDKRLQIESLRLTNEELLASNEEILRQQEILTERARDIELANTELSERYDQLQAANEEIERRNANITESLEYAHTIQQAILPSEAELRLAFREAFVLYKPQAIVSGDFYWLHTVSLLEKWGVRDSSAKPTTLIAVADCTGHGVPGAFMSMIGNELLNQIVIEQGITNPERIIAELHNLVRSSLRQTNDLTSNQDGMDICLCSIEGNTITFAGAKRPLYVVKNGAVHELKGDRASVGGRQFEAARAFTVQHITLQRGEQAMLYLTSDGFVDQHNAEREKFGTNRLQTLLQEIAELPPEEQKVTLEDALAAHQRSVAQRDDVTIIGVRVAGT